MHQTKLAERYVMGVDLGGTKVRAAVANLGGDVLAEAVQPTHPDGGARLVEQISQLAGQLCAQGRIDGAELAATVVGGAGATSEGRSLNLAPNLGVESLDLRGEFEEALGHPVLMENDANAAAYAELKHGHGRSLGLFVFIAIGTGIGMGIVSDGQLFRGAHGAAGEIGYLPFGPNPFDVANHARGALEEQVSGGGLARRYTELTGVSADGPKVFDEAARGDADALKVLEEEARLLAQGISAVAAVLDPDAAVLGGGIGSRSGLITPISRWLGELGRSDLPLLTSQLGERACLVGAIDLAVEAASRQISREEPVA